MARLVIYTHLTHTKLLYHWLQFMRRQLGFHEMFDLCVCVCVQCCVCACVHLMCVCACEVHICSCMCCALHRSCVFMDIEVYYKVMILELSFTHLVVCVCAWVQRCILAVT